MAKNPLIWAAHPVTLYRGLPPPLPGLNISLDRDENAIWMKALSDFPETAFFITDTPRPSLSRQILG